MCLRSLRQAVLKSVVSLRKVACVKVFRCATIFATGDSDVRHSFATAGSGVKHTFVTGDSDVRHVLMTGGCNMSF